MGANPARQTLRPEAIGAVMEVTKWLKPSISRPSDGTLDDVPLLAIENEYHVAVWRPIAVGQFRHLL
jgi:hypothetical protein